MLKKSKGVSQVVGATALLALAISATGIAAVVMSDSLGTIQNSVENQLEDEQQSANAELSSYCDGTIVLYNTGSTEINLDLVFGPDGDPVGGNLQPGDTIDTGFSSGTFTGQDVVAGSDCS